MKEKYCCFQHPKKDYKEKELADLCPDCNLAYGFPLSAEYTPRTIGDFIVLRPLNRGYYGATYIVERHTSIRTKKLVLKVVPAEIYKFFGKNFHEECKLHASAAEGAQHIVNIEDVFETIIEFGSISIPCHVAILDYVEGQTLKNIIESNTSLRSASVGQIAIDLLKILLELQSKQVFHNDLHPGNIIVGKLKDENRRIGELDESIKAVAIDFGSLGKKTQSGDQSERKGDLHQVAQILNVLSQKILDNPHNSEEKDYRLAGLLEERARILFPRITSTRVYEFEEVIIQIRNAFIQVDSPWRQTLSLKNFKDSYNAQTLSPWFVPSLLVDDDDRWISEISNRGPQVITGMRGCGKTMLIRALQFHARAIPRDSEERKDSSKIIQRLQKEEFVGLYVSCTRLLDKLGDQQLPLHEPFARLFVAFVLEAINALRHLRELDRSVINKKAFELLANAVADQIDGTDELRAITDEYEIERYLKRILNNLSKGEKKYTIKSNPANTFPHLANIICECSSIWRNHYVFFLLDDVSTRFLDDQNIIKLVSSLLFQNEFCGFKFTTEAQTLEMVIRSPGNIESARIGRDYTVFDLGEQVNEKIHSNKREGISFVEKILFKRAQFHSGHPRNIKPSELLGDVTLTSIAEEIAKPGKASDKKGLYHGITSIAGVCVGDIGDIITLYEMILKRRNGKIPISSIDQNECYLELCNSRLYDINRRDSRLFDFAQSFAEAAHSLLIQSYKQNQSGDKKRLRQYSSIFINITTGDKDKQKNQVRELIDAGIFNFSGGPEASRTNRQGANPQQQFKLTYRKLYGINKHIGLAQADRFELSAEPLEDWLNSPKMGKEILLRNLKSSNLINDDLDFNDIIYEPSNDLAYQGSLFENLNERDEPDDKEEHDVVESLAKEKTPISSELDLNLLPTLNNTGIMAGLGFEECTFESLKRIVTLSPTPATLIQYSEKGKSSEIIALFNERSIAVKNITYPDAVSDSTKFPERTLYDITGLPQSIAFNSIRNALLNYRNVQFAFTAANQYYPLDKDILPLLKKHKEKDYIEFLASLTNILKGEKGPYKLVPLLPKEINPFARRVLVAFSSPKHERLYALLDEREYDKIHIIAPSGNTPRNELARIAAEVAVRKFNHAEITELESDNLQGIMEYLSIQYQNYFINQNFSFEIAITGSKIQTIACAAICSLYKISQCWYVQPSEWDAKRFTKGTGETKVYSIKRN
jgi:serine/threonine protein kinase